MTWCVCACVDNKGPGLVLEARAGSIRHLLGASDFKQKCDPGGAVGMGWGVGGCPVTSNQCKVHPWLPLLPFLLQPEDGRHSY